jgi:lysozyme family protein
MRLNDFERIVEESMADFKKAWDKTSGNEGGYVNNSKDGGKETYRGITMKDHPAWEGWNIVHQAIKDLGIADTLDTTEDIKKKIDYAISSHTKMEELVQNLYKENYWNPLDLDNELDQLIAEQVFDTAVNMGVETARGFIKTARKKENA